jgi:glycolate oxidase iron-sulfur subunit
MGAGAGTYNLLHPEPARELDERRTITGPATGAELMVVADRRRPRGLDAGRDRPRPHERRGALARTVQARDAALRGVPLRQLLERALDDLCPVVTHAIPQTTTVPIRGAAPSSPVS